MNSTIANSSSTIDIPAVTSRRDSSLPHAPKEGRCQHLFPNGKRCRKFASGSHLGLCLNHLTASAAIGAGFHQPPDDSLDLSAELLPELSEFESAIDINKFLARLLVLVTKGRISPRLCLGLHHQPAPPLPSRHRPRNQSVRRRAPANHHRHAWPQPRLTGPSHATHPPFRFFFLSL